MFLLIIFVYGASGVDKTTLRKRVEQKLIEQALPDLEIDKGRIPVVGIEAVAPESRNFNWKDLKIYWELKTVLNLSDIRRKIKV